jgi:enoyl-CoA hydratase
VDVLLKQSGSIAYVTVNRPAALNALNRKVLLRLEEIFAGLGAAREIRTVVITGAGEKAFIAGADIGEIREAGEHRPELIEEGKRILSKIGTCPKVVIAAVNGYALGGGCELALFCDIRVAAETATFGFPEAKLGLMPAYGGTQLLPRLVGPARAKYLMLSGEIVDAATAHEIGLVERVCPRDRLTAEVESLATTISANGPLSLEAIKRAVDGGLELPLSESLKLESEQYRRVALSRDADLGIAGFLAKERPAFRGN